jgi:membrane dipeptidase
MDRRRLLKAGLGLAAALVPGVNARARALVPVADMHFHLFFFGPRPAGSVALAKEMAAGAATLAAWALVGDVPWLRPVRRGIVQVGSPGPGEALAWFHAELDRIKRYLDGQGLKIVRTPADVDLALQGEPHIVLAVEGATFLDQSPGPLEAAYDAGIRQVQLVHYIRNPIGDFQTAPARYHGLTELGRNVVTECNRLGILVDLAHCTPAAVGDALSVSKAPLVWSHSSVAARWAGPLAPVWEARRLPLASARAIADKGGVVGLWAMRPDVGQTIAAYANRLAAMADLLGEDHAGFGTDRNGVANPVIASFADLQRVVMHWELTRLPERRINKLAIGNYARVLKEALAAGKA